MVAKGAAFVPRSVARFRKDRDVWLRAGEG
jgi:hypothetical protein